MDRGLVSDLSGGRCVLASEFNHPAVHHALQAGMTAGATLCKLAEPPRGWTLFGFTRYAGRITCLSCRAAFERVAAVRRRARHRR